METYSRLPITVSGGKGVRLVDTEGREYLDCLGGIASCALGHADDRVADAIARQAASLVQPSNFFRNVPAEQLATRLHESAGGWGRVFLANSGAEANEAAIKLVRKWAGRGRFKVVCAEGSFHGRTLATLAATGQAAKWEGFEPLPAGFTHVTYNDAAAFDAAVDSETAAILVEPVLGEGGVVPATREFLEALRALATDRSVALVFDEVQTGMGRTGNWWAFQAYGVTPDVFTAAKALGNGVPIGAVVARDEIAATFGPGDHGSTFGGNPLAAAAALATFDALEGDHLLDLVPEKSEFLRRQLEDLPYVVEVRGLGLMLAAVLGTNVAGSVCASALEKGLVVNAVAPDAIRFVPPLTITTSELEEAVRILRSAMDEVLER
ncbi:MAG: acetylornithine/succinylornithine family transaminase [Actinobacteria bacterium ATB1]|nr:acetylornithine/succinylornithine family transaminase [Actinobacteria bacterium ATB1]